MTDAEIRELYEFANELGFTIGKLPAYILPPRYGSVYASVALVQRPFIIEKYSWGLIKKYIVDGDGKLPVRLRNRGDKIDGSHYLYQ